MVNGDILYSVVYWVLCQLHSHIYKMKTNLFQLLVNLTNSANGIEKICLII